jgi:UDP-N-acetylglucosamine enolpyruvyl transferase
MTAETVHIKANVVTAKAVHIKANAVTAKQRTLRQSVFNKTTSIIENYAETPCVSGKRTVFFI